MKAKLQRRTVLSVASLAVTAAMTVMLNPPAGAEPDNSSTTDLPLRPFALGIRYGAIAYAPNGAVGKAWRWRTRSQAENAAMDKCGVANCEVLSWFTRCGALANDGSASAGGVGPTRSMAENDAITRLGGGRVLTWACNQVSWSTDGEN
ncbi:DUF4189 domain-containing protein [Mycobacterium intracellulare]|uniref:DUF4189 domain-containing protein n=1 Tax=Mycobacterium intracellulare TaxID=1767 RepID=UPI001EED5688|nr:DUF4189 domain-containing protein [Mycobacterium intracellulare]MEE3754823.1 DUF4189 domain-containing protein [Mycobacterium intracellulare]